MKQLISIDRFYTIMLDCIHKLETLGPEFKVDFADLKIKSEPFVNNHTLAQCAVCLDTSEHKIVQVLRFNKHLFYEGLEDVLISTAYHELCHYLQNKEKIRTGYLFINDQGQPEQIINIDKQQYFDSNNGHSPCWYKYVNKVNSSLQLRFPISDVSHPGSYEDTVLTSVEDDAYFILECDSCPLKIHFYNLTADDFKRLPKGFFSAICHSQLQGKKNNYCKCGGSLSIRSPKDEPNLLYDIIRAEFDYYITTEAIGGLFK